MSSGFFLDVEEITAPLPGCNFAVDGLGNLPVTERALIDELASELVGLFEVGEHAILPKEILTVLTHLDAEDLAAVVAAHSIIIGWGA